MITNIISKILKKPTVKIHSCLPQVSAQYPIYPAKEFKRKWVKNCAHAFQKYKDKTDNRHSLITAAKCPGMRGIVERGYVVQSWFDFTVEVEGDDVKFYYPDGLEKYLTQAGFDHADQLVTYFDTRYSPMKIPTGTNINKILKIWTPFHLDIPKGYDLMILPIPYEDQPFSACPGIARGFEADFNVHVFWNKQGRTHIPAGTPLCQFVPVKSESPELVMQDLTPETKAIIDRKQLVKHGRFIQ